MTSRQGVRPLRLMVIAAVIALLSTLFAATAAHAGTGSITGKVTKPSGSALSGSTVDLYSIADDDYWYERSVKTRSDGTYTFGSLDRGTYIVGFGAESRTYAAEFWSNREVIQDAVTISVGSTRVSSINARLAVGGKITGRVLTGSSSPRGVADADVAAYRYDQGEWTFGKSAVSSSDGSFTVSGLSDGQWTLEFNPPFEGPDADLALEYWEDSRTLDENDIFYVKPGTTVGGKDATLTPGGRISGRVTGPNGEPVVDALVFGYPADSKLEVGNVAFTDGNGDYVMTGLSAGQHRLEFVDGLEFDPFGDGPDYASEWWDDQSSFSTANPVTVSVGSTSSGKDAQLGDFNAPLTNTTPPTIVGTARVGEELTADPGRWSPHVDEDDFVYHWFADDQALSGEWRKTYTPGEGQAGKQIRVEVTANSRNGQSATITSAPTEPVLNGVLRNASKPTIRGELRVGENITITDGSWNVVGDTGMSVRADHELLADGVKVGIGSSHTLTPDLLGKKLSARVTASRTGYDPTTVTTDEFGPVTEGIFSPSQPVIRDVPIVGVRLEVPQVDGNGGRYTSFQWLANGTEIQGADQNVFTPTDTEIGKTLTVRMTRSKPGYVTLVEVSAPSEPVVASGTLQIESVTPPGIWGRTTVGEDLQVTKGQWQPESVHHPLDFDYQWLADGEPIPGATSSHLVPKTEQLGKRLSVTVTANRPGYASKSVTTAETAPITTGTPFGAPHNFGVTSKTVTSVDLWIQEVDGAAKYRVAYRQHTSTGSFTTLDNSDLTPTLTGLKPSTEYEIKIAAVRTDGQVSPYSATIRTGTLPLVAPQDLRVTDLTPTSVTLSWTKKPGISKYRISHGIGTGARTTVDVGDVSTKTITGLKPGTTYSISIASMLSDGTRSSYSPRIDALIPFLPPTNLASPGATSSTIALTWTKAPGATKYRISYGIGDGTRTAFTIADASSRTLTGLMPATTYSVMIAGVMADGTRSPYSEPIDVTTD